MEGTNNQFVHIAVSVLDDRAEILRVSKMEQQRGESPNAKANAARLAKLDQARVDAYRLGSDTPPDPRDLPCIEWYSKHGAQYLRTGVWSPSWQCVSSDQDIIRMMIDWAIRKGQAKEQFSATIQVPRGITASDDEIRAYWADAGIPAENIVIKRRKERETPPRSKQPPPRFAWGTCNVIALKNGARLFWYWRGQRDRQAGDEALKQESLELLEKLRGGGTSGTKAA